MFTGIIQAIGEITSITGSEDRTFMIAPGKLPLAGIDLGDSISVNGACLTVVSMENNQLGFDVSNETLQCTAFENYQVGDKVNLELSLLLSDRLSGHIVSGHVDCQARVCDIEADSRSVRFDFEAPFEYAKYLCKKGSVCIDGVSLTINETSENRFAVNIIPHTMQETIFSTYKAGHMVNIEIDLIARYLESLIGQT